MITFEPKHFAKFKFTPEQIGRYLSNAKRDLKIASEDEHLEVKFNYCYSAFIKAGITLIAAKGGVKVRSVVGHHIKIIQKMSEILNDEMVMAIGNAMRSKRNEDFYGGGIFISEKESSEYLEYVRGVLRKVEQLIK